MSYDDASMVGVLDDPSGFGRHRTGKKRPGIIGSDIEGEDLDDEEDNDEKSKDPSFSDALAELHHAVSDKIQSWNPYFAKGAGRPKGTHSKNMTTVDGIGNHNATALLGGETVKEGDTEAERLGAKTRIGKCTVLFSGNDFWERCIRTHERHDKVNGYRLHILRQQLIDDVWSKPAYILSLLLREMSKPKSERLDWLFWVDADTVILNPMVPIETFLPPQGTEFDDIYLMYSMDWNGLNNGVFPIRVNEWAVQLFSGIVAYRHFKPDDPLVFRDQSAMNELMREPQNVKHIIQAPQRWFNAYQGEHNETLQAYQVRRGDLLVHFAGIPARETVMHYWLQRAEQHLDDWEIPVKSTSYPQEARDFWNEDREKRKRLKQVVEDTRAKGAALSTQIDNHMIDYGERLNDEERQRIHEAREQLRKIFEAEATKEDVTKLQEAIDKLTEVSTTLASAQVDNNKLLQSSAHDAIFAGEKMLHAFGFHNGHTSPEAEAVSDHIRTVKAIIMAPEASWNRNDITVATNALTEARVQLQAKVDAELDEQNKAEADAKALQEAKLAAQLEAERYASEDAAVDVHVIDKLAPIDDVMGEESKEAMIGTSDAVQPGPQLDAGETDLHKLDEPKLPDNVVEIAVTATIAGPIVYVTANPDVVVGS